MKKILIPHLNYTVEYGQARGEDAQYMKRKGWNAMARSNNRKTLAQILFLGEPKKTDIPTLAHEVMHVLQYICEDRSITMEKEHEHMGYLMQYILNEILEYEYK